MNDPRARTLHPVELTDADLRAVLIGLGALARDAAIPETVHRLAVRITTDALGPERHVERGVFLLAYLRSFAPLADDPRPASIVEIVFPT